MARTTVLDIEQAINRVKAERPPKWVDMYGIDPDYTEGVPADEWLDANRGEA